MDFHIFSHPAKKSVEATFVPGTFFLAGFLPIAKIFFFTVGVLLVLHVHCRGGRGSIFIPPKHPGSLVGENYLQIKLL